MRNSEEEKEKREGEGGKKGRKENDRDTERAARCVYHRATMRRKRVATMT